ncbi:hypothetical protein DFJ77DRAFT_124920 [Powellomyces hirtus]|nr:hypothetical protein DFJ77DRAFT_124920 [Powellomyces hirtus]
MRTYESHFRLPRTPAYKLDAEQPVTTLLKHDAHVLDPLRLDTLHASFEQLAEKFRTFRPLLVDIKREYDLVIAALLNLTQEKAFLRSKIQNLICEVGSEQQLDQLRSALIQLTFRNSMVAEENEELKQNAESEEVNFLLNLARLCAPPPLKGPEDKQRSIIRLKERWDRVERWINNRANEEPLLKDLGARLAADVM